MRRTILAAVVVIVSACGGVVPTVPTVSSAPSGGTPFALTCSAPTILAGDIFNCVTTAGSLNVNVEMAWASSDPSVALSEGFGLFLGKSEGQATVSATSSGQTASALLTVHLQDLLRARAAAYQGSFQVGTIATVWLQGGYGVASADSGALTIVVTDQTGATISASDPVIVPHGGGRYLISTTFMLPAGTTRVCRKGVLQIGSTTLTRIPEDALVPCFAVTR